MTQFDVFDNPIAAARRAYPLVTVLQSDLANTGRERIVAPLAPRAKLRGTAGRLTPHVEIGGPSSPLTGASLSRPSIICSSASEPRSGVQKLELQATDRNAFRPDGRALTTS
ncbi:MAG: CcdB family protein [Deltaproteobacteria bacterium]|nr:CcdB family protein [Deltaproteobacteria bacterium]